MGNKINIPRLVPSSRKREFCNYTKDEHRNVVLSYLFDGKSHRELDREVLGLNSVESRGYQSMGILHCLGLRNEFKGLFKRVSLEEAIKIIQETNDDSYQMLLSILDGGNNMKSNILENDIEIETKTEFISIEGEKKEIYTTRYERNAKLRMEAINIHGTKCAVCGFDFFEKYGEIGKDYIEIHHIKPLSETGEIKINPKTDLIPVCSNCHRMIHRKKNQVIAIEKLKELLKNKTAT